ncbi:hypothetical protein [Streptomyces chryseus]|uniref:Uncharacterized protein n=1 Tax=Streptomyces chryseus TaxID=68186 RepID=A0ABQ3E7C0_9ACTN|nr:hypothetical protein [Streptomyces chryseus]GHB28439.1 hypothetical protein GCM10010346_59890 [Streptomyces chryseus]
MRLRDALALGVAAASLASPAAAAASLAPADAGAAHRAAFGAGSGVRADEEPAGVRADEEPVGVRADEGPAEYAEPLRAAAPHLRPTCGDPASPDFPITTRLRGGPDSYRAGGAAAEWSLELTNTTGRSCRNIHPVVVLMDGRRQLEPGQVELAFEDSAGRWTDVPIETTDEDEHIGVFDGGVPGFTVGADRTVTVKVRLGFAAGAAPGRAVVTAAVVQRQPADGEWVGASKDYRFTITGREPDADPDREAEADPDREAEADPDPGRSRDPGRDPEPDATLGPRIGDDGTPRIRERPHSLAMTGRAPGPLLALGATAGALLLGGGVLVALSRRRYATPTRGKTPTPGKGRRGR